ncbi:MAG: DUF433 domain-containing protein [bacterium]
MKNRITVHPNIHFGKPCVASTRITVQDVLELVREGLSFDVIIRDYYPDLEKEDIRACVQYAIDVLAVEDIHISIEAARGSCSTRTFMPLQGDF